MTDESLIVDRESRDRWIRMWNDLSDEDRAKITAEFEGFLSWLDDCPPGESR